MIITSQKQYKTVGIILCRNIGKKKTKCASQFIHCYQLESCSGDPNALKTLVCRLVGGCTWT